MNGKTVWLAAMTLLCALSGCAGEAEVAPAEGEPVVTAPERTEPLPAEPVDDKPARFAKVLETMDSAGYTFARLDACGTEAWVAGPPTPLEVGQAVSMPMGTVMTDFVSPTLGRTFEMILFVAWIKPIDAAEMPSCEAPAAPPQAAAGPRGGQPTMGPPAEDEWPGTVLETMNSGGYTYLRMKTCSNEEMWIAAPESKIAVGQPIAAWGGVPMTNFKSQSLDKTFPQILFAQSIRILSQPVTCK